MDITTLRELGLTEAEIKVYLALLEVNSAMASEIAEKIGLYRTNIYDLLESLIEKGLVSYVIKANRKHFMATNPNRILAYVKEKETKLKEQEKKIQKLIPDLLKLKKPSKEETKVEVYRGREGFKTFMNDLLKAKILYGIGYTGRGPEIDKYFYNNWNLRRIKAKIKRKYVVTSEVAKKKTTRTAYTDVKIVPKGFKFPSSTIIYLNKVLIFFPEQETVTGIVIESEGINKAYKAFYDLLWKMSK